MGLFNKNKDEKKKSIINSLWEDAYICKPMFYYDPTGEPFGAFALTEDTNTILLKQPNAQVDGKEVTKWMLFLATPKQKNAIGIINYNLAIKDLESKSIMDKGNQFLINGLSYKEMQDLANTYKEEGANL